MNFRLVMSALSFRPLITLSLAAGLTLCASAQSLISLGTLGGNLSVGYGINESGQVAGYSTLSGNAAIHAFRYDNGTMHDIGTIGGISSLGLSINDNGQMTGQSTLSGHPSQRAFLYDNGAMVDLGTLGGDFSVGHSINNLGQIAGHSVITGNSLQHAFLYESGSMIDLGTLGGGNSFAYAINDSGQVVGQSQTSINSNYHAFLFDNGVMLDLDTLGGDLSVGRGINNHGQVVGYSTIAGNSTHHAFLYDNGTMFDIGTLGDMSFAEDINDLGQVVGRFSNHNGYNAAFLFNGGVMTDLNLLYASLLSDGSTVGFTSLSSAFAINNQGQITGIGLYFDGVGTTNQAFLLDTQPNGGGNAVPDAGGTLGLLGGALAGMVAWRRRRVALSATSD